MAKVLRITKKGTGLPRVPQFQLFDRRKHFNLGPPRKPYAKHGPRVWTISFGDSPLIPAWLRCSPEPPAPPPPPPKKDTATERLGRRLLAIHAALSDVPREVRRMVRWCTRRALMPDVKFRDPLRPGRPLALTS